MPKLSKGSLFFALALMGGAGSSCSLAFNLGQDQCDASSDCQKRGFPASAVCSNHVCTTPTATTGSTSSGSTTGAGGSFPSGWECIGKFQYPAPQTVQQALTFVDALSQAPVTTIKMKLCGPLDSACSSPTMSGIVPDAMGNVTVTEPTMPGFYLDAIDDSSTSSTTSSSSSGTGGGAGMCCDSQGMNCVAEPGPGPAYRESIAYLGSSAGAPTIIPPTLKSIRPITNDGLCTLAKLVGKVEDLTHGVAVVLTPNCNDIRSAGVIVETADVDGETQELYFKNSVPNSAATETDDEGAVGWFNLPAPRSSTFTTKLLVPDCMADHTKCPVIGTATVVIRPATLTYVHVGPSP